MHTLSAISPLDGRYRSKVEPLALYFSEAALIKYRVWVEIEYFIALNTRLSLPNFELLSAKSLGFLRSIYLDFTADDALRVKAIEQVTNHDVKAVEYFIKEKIDASGDNDLIDNKEFIHFGLTSQDINNTAIPRMMKDAMEHVYLPLLREIVEKLREDAQTWKHISLLAYTHGQPASPTTLGKEFAVFVARLEKQLEKEAPVEKKPFKWGNAFSCHLRAYGPAVGGWKFSQHPRVVGDVDGDGKADIIAFSDVEVYVSLSKGDGTFTAPRATITNALTYYRGGWHTYNQYPRMLGDVNGDGKADIVGFASNGVYVHLATGNGNFDGGRHVLNSYGTSAGGWNSFHSYPRALADVNGDGKADIVGYGHEHVYVSLSNGNSFDQPYVALSRHFTIAGTWSNSNTFPRFAADVNGDGKADLIAVASDGVYVALGNGRDFQSPRLAVREFGPQAGGWSNFDTYPREVKDVNGDGRADFIGFSCCSVCYAFGKEDGTFTPIKCTLKAFVPETSWSNFETYPRMLGDINGDKRADIVGFASEGVWASFAEGDY